ncbi:MAG: hypothetical protein ACI3YI_06845, partial [Bacteroidaceae bacterium]
SFYELLAELDRHPYLMRGRVKFRARVLREHIKAYNRKNDRRALSGGEFIANINEEFEEMLEGDLEKLYYTTLNYMHKIRIREPELQARMVLADTFAKGMIHNVDECVRKESGELNTIYIHNIRRLAEHDVSNACLQLVDEIGKEFAHDDKLPVLDGELSIYHGFQTIMNKLGEPDRIYKVVEKWGGMQVNDKKDVPVGAEEVTNLNAERE